VTRGDYRSWSRCDGLPARHRSNPEDKIPGPSSAYSKGPDRARPQGARLDPVIGRGRRRFRRASVCSPAQPRTTGDDGEPGGARPTIVERPGRQRIVAGGDVPEGQEQAPGRGCGNRLAHGAGARSTEGEFEPDRLKAVLREITESTARSSASSTSYTPWGARGRRRGGRRGQNAEAGPGRGECAEWSATTWTSTASHIEQGPALEDVASSRCWCASPRWRTQSRFPARPKEKYESPPQGEDQGRGAGGRGGALAPLHREDRFWHDKAIDLIDDGLVPAANRDRLDARRAGRDPAAASCSLETSGFSVPASPTRSRRERLPARSELAELREVVPAPRASGRPRRPPIMTIGKIKERGEARGPRWPTRSGEGILRSGRAPLRHRWMTTTSASQPRTRDCTSSEGGRMLKEEVGRGGRGRDGGQVDRIPVTRPSRPKVRSGEDGERLAERVVGQREAIVAVSNAGRRSPIRSLRPNRPSASSCS